MPDFGIGEFLATVGAYFATDAGVAAGAAGLADAAAVGVGADAGILGSLGGGIAAGELAVPAAAGIAGASAAAGAGELISDAAGGATIAEGVPLVSTYGDVAGAFGAGAADAAGAASAAAPALSATDLSSLGVGTAEAAPSAPAAITSGADATGLATAPTALTAGPVPSTVAPGVTGGLESGTATQTASSLGLAGQAPAGGPTAAAFTAPPSVTGALDPTSAAALGAQSDLVPAGSAQLGADVVSPQATADALNVDTASTLVPPAGGATSPDSIAALNTPYAQTAFSDSGITGASGGSSGGGIFSKAGDAVDSAGKFLSSPTGKLLGVGLTGASLLKDLITPSSIPGLSGLTNVANTEASTGQNLINEGLAANKGPTAAATALASGAASQGAALTNYLTSGTLPPGVRTAINNATAGTIASIKARHASQGTSGSSAEAQEIASAEQSAVTQGTSIATSLLSSGVSLENLSAQVYNSLISQNNTLLQTGASLTGTAGGTLNTLVNQNVAQNNEVNSAISNLATALGGGTKITLAGTQAA
jgi:hypothetical protein